MEARTLEVQQGGVTSVAEAGGSQRQRITLAGVAIDPWTPQQVIDHILSELDAERGGWVITPNLDHLRRASFDKDFQAMLQEAELVVADGMPLIWASKLQSTPLPCRVAGSSLVEPLAQAAAERGRSIYLLGGEPGAAEDAAKILLSRSDGLRIAGVYCPPMGFERDEAEIEKIRQQLHVAMPDIVYVALGSPKQEYVIRQLRSELPGTWWLGIGISLSFLCGRVKRAPQWMQKLGLEWLHRLVQEPRRLARRYLVEGLPFAGRMMGKIVLRRAFCGWGERKQ